jgi:hypothetical protein
MAFGSAKGCRAVSEVLYGGAPVRAARVALSEESGHPAKRQGSCLQCYSKADGPLCAKCARSSAEEHRALASGISKLRGSKCEYCAAESVAAVVFAGGHGTPFCEHHAREWRALDFIPSKGVVSYGSLPHVVGGK